jgi:hypothetical protein
MLDYNRIYNSFKGAVGFRQTTSPENQIIDYDLTTSASGLYVNDLSKNWLISRNFELCIPDFRQFTYQVWSNATTYAKNDRISLNGKIYYSLQDSNLNQNPESQPTFWQLIGNIPSLSTYLNEVREASIKELLSDVLAVNNSLNANTDLLCGGLGTVLRGDLKAENPINQGKLRGFQLIPEKRNDIQLNIQRIGLTSDTIQDLTVYVYHSSQPSPIFEATISIISPNDFVWYDLLDANGNPCNLTYLQQPTNAGGSFYIGVFESDFVGNVKEFDLRMSGDVYNPYFENYKAYTFIREFGVRQSDLNSTDLWNIENTEFESGKALFNLQISGYSDKTQTILDSAKLWYSAIQYKIAVKLFQDMFNSLELNRVVSSAKNEIGQILYGNQALNIKGMIEKSNEMTKNLVNQYTDNIEGFEDNLYFKFNYA